MIYFDLDQVLRDLHGHLGYCPLAWTEKISGLSVVKYYSKHPKLLEVAPVTEYFNYIVSRFNPVHVITSQPESWIKHTKIWLQQHLPTGHVIYDAHKLQLLSEDDVLVDDYPLFADYSKVIVIDRPYNRCIQLSHQRVRNVEELATLLEMYI